MHACPRVYVEIEGWFTGVSSVLQLCGFRNQAQGVRWHSISWTPAADVSSCPTSIPSPAAWSPVHDSDLISVSVMAVALWKNVWLFYKMLPIRFVWYSSVLTIGSETNTIVWWVRFGSHQQSSVPVSHSPCVYLVRMVTADSPHYKVQTSPLIDEDTDTVLLSDAFHLPRTLHWKGLNILIVSTAEWCLWITLACPCPPYTPLVTNLDIWVTVFRKDLPVHVAWIPCV